MSTDVAWSIAMQRNTAHCLEYLVPHVWGDKIIVHEEGAVVYVQERGLWFRSPVHLENVGFFRDPTLLAMSL